MSSDESKKWNNLTVIQLKGALSRRGLEASGTKEEVKQRLIEYEEQKAQKNKKSKDCSFEEDESGGVPIFSTKFKVKNGYDAYQALKTIIIHPFSTDLFQDVNFVTWLNDSKSFTIQKTYRGEMAAELVFPACSHGEVAYSNLKSSLPDFNIRHPTVSFMDDDRSDKLRKPEGNFIDEILKLKPEGNFWSRLVVLEGLSSEFNNEEKLVEFFPEAYNHISYQYSQETAGLAILEFFSEEECDHYVTTIGKEPIQVGEDDIKVEKFSEKFKEWRNVGKKTKESKSASKASDAKKIMPDKERLLLNSELIKMKNLIDSMTNIDVQSQEEMEEKLKKFNICVKKMSAKTDKLRSDTYDRLNANKKAKLPESAEDYQEVTLKALVQKNPDFTLPKEIESKYVGKIQDDLASFNRELSAAKEEAARLNHLIQFRTSLLPKKNRKEPEVIVIEDDQTNRKSNKKPESNVRRAEKRPPATRKRSKSREKEQSPPKKEEQAGGELFISKIDKFLSENWVKSHLDKHFPGSITIRLPMKSKNQNKGFAFMTFPNDTLVDEYASDPRKTDFYGHVIGVKNNNLGKRGNQGSKSSANSNAKGEPPVKMRRENKSPDRHQDRRDRDRSREGHSDNRERDGNSDDYRKYYERLQQRFDEDHDMDRRMDRSDNNDRRHSDVDDRMLGGRDYDEQMRRGDMSHQMSDPMYVNDLNQGQMMSDSFMRSQQQMFDNNRNNQAMNEQQQMFERMNNPMQQMDDRQMRMSDSRDIQGMNNGQGNQRMMNDPYYHQDRSNEKNPAGNDPKIGMLRDMTSPYSDSAKQMELQYGMITGKDQMAGMFPPVPKVQNSGAEMSRQLASMSQMNAPYPAAMAEGADSYGQMGDSPRKTSQYQQQQQQRQQQMQQQQQQQQPSIKQDYQSPYMQQSVPRGGGGGGGTIVEYDIRALKAARDREAAAAAVSGGAMGLQSPASLPNAIPSPLEFYKQLQHSQQTADVYRNRPY